MSQALASFNQYLLNQVETAPPERLMLMLFDAMVRFTKQAIECLEGGDLTGANTFVKKTQNILVELMITMDVKKGGDTIKNVQDVYECYRHQLMVSIVKKDVEILRKVHEGIVEWRGIWTEAVRNYAAEKNLQRVV